jgi:uncharacterized protein (DUF488 family)
VIYTIGHSAHSAADLLAVLKKHDIGTVIDVRTHPMSKWEQFNLDSLIAHTGWLAVNGIDYQWRSSLAGWQARHANDSTLVARMNELGVDLRTYGVSYHPSRTLRTRAHGHDHGWVRRHESDFSWYTVMPEFQTAALGLMAEVTRGVTRTPALLCSEYNWADCHRAQIADFIAYHHGGVSHLVGNEVIPHDWHLLSRMNKYNKNVVAAWGGKTHATA